MNLNYRAMKCVKLSQFPQTFLTNPSRLRIYRCKIPTVITETLIDSVNQTLYSLVLNHKTYFLPLKNIVLPSD